MPIQNSIHITEVAPRDGFQILPRLIPLDEKLDFIQNLIDAGCAEIEATSFVNPKWVPQMKDSRALCRQLLTQKKAIMTYLVPNLRGAQLAIDAGAKQFFLTTSASKKHSRENLNQTIEEVLQNAVEVAKLAKQHDVECTASIAAAFGYSKDCEGVPSQRVCMMVETLADAGFTAITLCDTSGDANPDYVYELCGMAMKRTGLPLGIHLHQAGGIEFANAYAAFRAGVRTFESAAGGMGGCPFVKSAKGNIATETLVEMFHSMGYETGIDMERMQRCAEQAKRIQARYGIPENEAEG